MSERSTKAKFEQFIKARNGDRRHNPLKEQLWLKANKLCGICKGSITWLEEASIDHIKPLSKGGKNILENMRITHMVCNSKRGNKWP